MKKTLVLTSIFAIMTVAPAVANIPSSAFMQQQITAQITEAIADKADTTVVTALDNKIGTLPTGYETVGAALSAMVSTAASANQTLAGTYTVSGSMSVTGAMDVTGVIYTQTPSLPTEAE